MTRFNNKYPYTDFHELNADWLLETVKDAEAEAKEAADTVATYNNRLTTVEGDLAPIKAAMPGLASDVSDLQHDVGIMDSLITNTINPDIATLKSEVETASTGLLDRMTAAEGSISTLKNEVETPTTGLLDRVTALEKKPAGQSGITEYLRFGTGSTPIDWDARITYTYLDDLIAITASADKTVNIILVEDDELGTTWYYTLNEGEYQISAGTPRGQFTFVCRKPVLDGNNVVTGYKTCTVTVNKNAATPTFAEENEIVLPAVTSGDAGDVLTVDNNGDWVAATPGGGGETRTPITVTPNVGGITILNNRSYYTDKDIVIDVYVNTTSARTGAYILAISSTTLTALNSILPIDVNEIDPGSYAAITGCGGSISLYDANDEWINVTCPAAGLLHIYGVYAKAV